MAAFAGGLPPRSFSGKVAVISGAANFGIGWGLATHCAGVLGMKVAILDLQATATQNAVAELRNACPGADALAVVCDVTSVDDMRESVRAVQQKWPQSPIGALCESGSPASPASPPLSCACLTTTCACDVCAC